MCRHAWRYSKQLDSFKSNDFKRSAGGAFQIRLQAEENNAAARLHSLGWRSSKTWQSICDLKSLRQFRSIFISRSSSAFIKCKPTALYFSISKITNWNFSLLKEKLSKKMNSPEKNCSFQLSLWVAWTWTLFFLGLVLSNLKTAQRDRIATL